MGRRECNLAEDNASIQAINSNVSDTDLIVPGHGSAQRPHFPLIAKTHDHVNRMRNTMQKTVEDGASMIDAVQAVEFEDWQEIPLYEMNQRANANFVYREMEEAYFNDF